MKQAEITVLAREAGVIPDNNHPAPETRYIQQMADALQRFEALIAAATREACIKTVKDLIEEAIRLRGVHPYAWEAVEALRASNFNKEAQ